MIVPRAICGLLAIVASGGLWPSLATAGADQLNNVAFRACAKKHHATVGAMRYGVRQRACVTPSGEPGILTFRGYGHHRRCACAAKPPPPQPRRAEVALLMRTEENQPGLATFDVSDSAVNHITIYFLGLPLVKYTSGISGHGEAQIEVLDDRVRILPESIWVRSPSNTFLGRILGGTRTEMIRGQAITPLEFDGVTGPLLKTTTINLRTNNWFYTENNPLFSEATVGGSFDLSTGKFYITLAIDFL